MELPAHPLLRPGARVTRRGDGLLQLGLDQPRRVVTADCPDVRRALSCLEAGRQPDLGVVVVARLCRDLLVADLLVDGDLLLADLAQAPVHAAYGLDAGAVLERRARHGITVLGPPALVAQGEALLPDNLGRDPLVTLVIGEGILPREQVDDLVRVGQAHLVLQRVEERVEVGPFVAPGLTACLRCVDGHRAEADPRRSLVLEQYAGPRGNGLPETVDAAVHACALAWAVRDCLTYVDGYEPATWSRTITFGPGMARVERDWLRHPHCGCTWADAHADRATG
jgi:hypothetical protein